MSNELAALKHELGMLVDLYNDGDRQDPELRHAIRKTKARIKALETGRTTA